jgi:hypothetical protein
MAWRQFLNRSIEQLRDETTRGECGVQFHVAMNALLPYPQALSSASDPMADCHVALRAIQSCARRR